MFTKLFPCFKKKCPKEAPHQLTKEERKFSEALLEWINIYREKHGCPPLQYSEHLTKTAVRRAKYLALLRQCDYETFHYGENIRKKTAPPKPTVKDIAAKWYSQILQYDFDANELHSGTACFTQMIWKKSKEFGAAMWTDEKNEATVVSALYDPIGNNVNFKKNVPRSLDDIKEYERRAKVQKAEEEDKLEPLENLHFESQCLAEHNHLRRLHGCPPLKLDRKLSDAALSWAKKVIVHIPCYKDENCVYGVNMYDGMSPLPLHGEIVTKNWYDEITKYDYATEKHSKKTEHFTQIIWKSTTHLGVAHLRENDSSREIVFCYYSPRGNVDGQYSKNVLPLGSIDKSRLEKEILLAHNRIRKLHGAPPLELDKDLQEKAQDRATELARRQASEDVSDQSLQQNVAFMKNLDDFNGRQVLQRWYRQYSKYNYDAISHGKDTAKFTAVVWVATRKLGVGITKRDKIVYIVCDYDPPGNIQGEYERNVLKKAQNEKLFGRAIETGQYQTAVGVSEKRKLEQ